MLTPDQKFVCALLHISESEFAAMSRSGIQRLLDTADKNAVQDEVDGVVSTGGFRERH